MSYIYDALQRAEAERGGAGAAGVAELLQRSEHASAEQRRSSHRSAVARKQQTAAQFAWLLNQQTDGSTEEMQETDGGILHFATLEVDLTPNSLLVALADRHSAAAEAFRLLAVRLRHLRHEHPLQTVLVTSTLSQEGKSLISANLACTLGADGREPVLLIEGDLRRPSLLPLFHAQPLHGLGELMRGECAEQECIHRLQGTATWILPAGNAGGDPLALLQSAEMNNLLARMTRLFAWIIIDSPPLLPLGDASVLSRLADGILLSTRPGVTKKKHFLRGIAAMDQEKLLGAVIDSSRKTTSDYDYYLHGIHETLSAAS
jgi:capsular exopolysaccharide synthesis family protein